MVPGDLEVALFERRAVLGNTDRDGDWQRRRKRELERLGRDRRANALGQKESRRDAGARQKHDEFLASVPSGNVTASDFAGDAVSELPQHFVARQMPEAIVDGFEVVDVDHEARQRRALAAAASELLVQARLQIAAVV